MRPNTPTAVSPLLRLDDVHKSYGGVRALRGISLDVFPGEVHALVGENGAGKSTLIKVIAGAIASDLGTLTWDGTPMEVRSVAESMQLGVRVIFQHLNVLPHLTVAQNLSLGREASRLGLLRESVNRKYAAEALDRLGLDLDLDRPAGELRVAEKQLLEIARALSGDARLLIMDEPTASLGKDEVDRLLALIRELRANGIAILYISHRMPEILSLADRVTVLRDGALVGTVPSETTTEDQLIKMMVGRELATSVRTPSGALGPEVLRVSDLHTAAGLRGVSLSVARGEILGVYGLLGSGRTELARAVFGVDRVVAGEMCVDGRPIAPKSSRQAIQLGIGLVAEDRETQGLFRNLSVRRNLTSASADLTSRLGWISSSAEKSLTSAAVRDLRIKTSGIEQSVSDLSGGNQQKVTVGRWTIRQSKVMILDDPTAGVDVGAKEDFYRLIARMAETGTAVLLMSSDLPEILRLSDRILVLYAGREAATLSGADRTEDAVVRMAFGN